jgi:enhancing lycopene biosynthesis protein 2
MVYENDVKLTIGTDEETASAINALGATHINCNVEDIVIDNDAKLVTTPAYMLAQDLLEAKVGITKMVQTVLAMK